MEAVHPFLNVKRKTPSDFGNSAPKKLTPQHRANERSLEHSANPRLPHLFSLKQSLLPIRQELRLGSPLRAASIVLRAVRLSPGCAKRETIAFAWSQWLAVSMRAIFTHGAPLEERIQTVSKILGNSTDVLARGQGELMVRQDISGQQDFDTTGNRDGREHADSYVNLASLSY